MKEYRIMTFLSNDGHTGKICGCKFNIFKESAEELMDKLDFIIDTVKKKNLILISLQTKIEEIKNYKILVDNLESCYLQELAQKEKIVESINKEIQQLSFVYTFIDNYCKKLFICLKKGDVERHIDITDTEFESYIKEGYHFQKLEDYKLYLQRQ